MEGHGDEPRPQGKAGGGVGAEVQGTKLSCLASGGEKGFEASGAARHGEGQGKGAAPGKEQALERIGPDHGIEAAVSRMQGRGPDDEGNACPEAPAREQLKHEGHGKDPYPLAEHGTNHEKPRGRAAVARPQLQGDVFVGAADPRGVVAGQECHA